MIDVRLDKIERRRLAGFNGNDERWGVVQRYTTDHSKEFPLLSSLNPWGDTTFREQEAKQLLEELKRLQIVFRSAPESTFLLEFEAMCEKVSDKEKVELVFLGD